MKLTNTILHALVGLASGIILAVANLWLLSLKSISFDLGWFFVFVFALITINWEYNQYKYSTMTFAVYVKEKWFDSVVDLIIANGCFFMPMYLLGAIFF